MKHTLMTLLMILTVIGVNARNYSNSGIGNQSKWANSTIEYTAEVKADGSILFTGCDEGQDLAFRFSPKKGKKGEYQLSAKVPYGYENPFSDCTRAKHMRTEEHDLICMYDNQGRLRDVLTNLGELDAQREADWKKTCQLLGEYTSIYGDPLTIDGREEMSFDGNFIQYLKIVFNSLITNVIQINGDKHLDGYWDVKITPEGLILRKVTTDENFCFFEPTGEEDEFSWARKDIPRFRYASEILLNGDQLRGIDKATLRLMRNEILFHHGYVPVSEDLKEYLADKEWYTPRASNDGIFNELNLVETLNIELIKTAEALN